MKRIVRAIFCVVVSMITSGGCGQGVTVESERARLQGKWEVVSQEVAGIKVPAEVGRQYEFAGDEFRSRTDPSGKFGAWRKYELNVTTNPKQIDWIATSRRTDKTSVSHVDRRIYRIKGDELQICYLTLTTPTEQRPSEFLRKPYHVILTLKRIPFANPDEERARNEAARTRTRDAAHVNLQAVIAGRYADGKYHIDFPGLSGVHHVADRIWHNLLVLQDIRKLCLRGCTGVGNEQMLHLGKLVSVEILDLHSTDISDAGLERLSGLINLEQLDLSFTSVSDAGLAAIAKLKKLKKLTLKGSLVTEKGVEELRKKRFDLEVIWRRPYAKSEQEAALALSQSGFGVDDDFYPYATPRTVTCQITFTNRNIAAPSAVAEEAKRRWPPYGHEKSLDQSVVTALLGKLPAPTAVTIRPIAPIGNVVTDEARFNCLRNIQGLVRLVVASTKITDTVLVQLKNHPTLKVLDLDFAKQISDVGIASLSSLTNLEVLHLRGVKSTPEALANLLTLEHLRELHITHRQMNYDLNMQFRKKSVKLMITN